MAGRAHQDDRRITSRTETQEAEGNQDTLTKQIGWGRRAARRFLRSALELPELVSQESQDAFAAAVAGLQTPTESADLVALLRAYQDAMASVMASREEVARSEVPASIELTYINGVLIANKTYPLPSSWGDGLTTELNCICEGFGNQPDGQWVAANAHRFEFIVRYPPGKEQVTGYIWEPWHLRYLGVENATAVYNSGVSLEECLGITSSYG